MNVQFKHYKGGIYNVIGIGEHTENGKQLVAYYDSEGRVWFRPSEMFFGTIEVDGKKVKRFEKIPTRQFEQIIKQKTRRDTDE